MVNVPPVKLSIARPGELLTTVAVRLMLALSCGPVADFVGCSRPAYCQDGACCEQNGSVVALGCVFWRYSGWGCPEDRDNYTQRNH